MGKSPVTPGNSALPRRSGRGLCVLAVALSTACDSCAPTSPPGTVGSTRKVSEKEQERTVAAPRGSSGHPARTEARELTWVYDRTPAGPMHVVVSVPAARPNEKFPVLIAMHGRGEAFKGPAEGARGWVDDYGLNAAVARLASPPLTRSDFGNMVLPSRLEKINTSLRRHGYRGLIVVCPYTPDLLAGDRPFDAARGLEQFLVDDLLPRVRREAPALESRESTGIDGVSLGGRASMLVGLARPESFGVVAALQPAFQPSEVRALADRARAALSKTPRPIVRLLSSDRDFFLEPTRSIASALRDAAIEHRLDVVAGDHSYEFNRGPGVYEMLLFHDRALRGERYLE